MGKLINISEATSFPAPRELTPEEESALIAQWKKERPQAVLDEEYRDFDEQVANGVSAEQLLKELRSLSPDEK